MLGGAGSARLRSFHRERLKQVKKFHNEHLCKESQHYFPPLANLLCGLNMHENNGLKTVKYTQCAFGK